MPFIRKVRVLFKPRINGPILLSMVLPCALRAREFRYKDLYGISAKSLSTGNNIKTRLPRLIINVPCGSHFITIIFLPFSSYAEKNWPLSIGYFSTQGEALVAVTFVMRQPL